MNILTKTISSIARACLGKSIEAGSKLNPMTIGANNGIQGGILGTTMMCMGNIFQGLKQVRTLQSDVLLWRMHMWKPHKKKKRRPLNGKPFAKGTVIKTVIRKPKKPNSANRKCVIVRLSTGKEMTAYVPGIGHNLQEHNMVLCRVGRLQDTPGVKIKCVRGKFDLPHVVKQK